MRKLQLKRYRWVMLLLAPVLTYLAAAMIGSLMPENADWNQPPDGVEIYIADNGVHTGLILPASADGIDLSQTFRPTDLPDSKDAGQWLMFGWGDRDFFLNTPTWSAVRPKTVVTALFGSSGALLHVDHLARPENAYGPRVIRLTRAQYRKLVQSILTTAKRDAEGHPAPIPGYSDDDVFYPANGRYHVFHTCNNWTRDILAGAGVKVGRWTPFAGGVMRWF